MNIVFDSSTLILLAKTDLLREAAVYAAIIIPERVKTECLIKESNDALLIATLIKEKRIVTKKAGSAAAVQKIQKDFKLEAGEAEALWLAKNMACPLAVDDLPAIKACKIMGLQFVTAIHFVVRFAEQGALDAALAQEKLNSLAFYGRYSRWILEDASRRLKGETI